MNIIIIENIPYIVVEEIVNFSQCRVIVGSQIRTAYRDLFKKDQGIIWTFTSPYYVLPHRIYSPSSKFPKKNKNIINIV